MQLVDSPVVRSALKWAGVLCLCLAFVPYYSRKNIEAPPDPIPAQPADGGLWVRLPTSRRTDFRVGLPFSPWFEYHKKVVYERMTADSYNSNVRSEGGIYFPNWSSALAAVGLSLLIGKRWLRTRPDVRV